jgi:hypothetical protein
MGKGKIWEIAARFNKESEEHTFDRHGNKLTKEVKNRKGEPEIVSRVTFDEMRKRRCLKYKTLNVSRRVVSEEEFKPVGSLK